MLPKVNLYTDGAAKGNPEGPGGYGFVLQFVDSKGTLHEKEGSKGFVKTSNNRMELMAAIAGLEALVRPCEVTLYSDSQYLVKAFNAKWIETWINNNWLRSKKEPVKNADLWKRLLKAIKPHKVSFIWVKGHFNNPLNERCDKLATAAAKGKELFEDEIWEDCEES